MVAPLLPLPQPQVALFDDKGKPTQPGFEFLDRLQSVVKQINAAVTALTALPTPAPVGAQYVTMANDGTLSAERVLTAGSGISLTDGGANGPVTIANTQTPGGMTLASSASVGSGTTYTVTGLGGYKMFLVWLRGVSHNDAGNQSFRVELSGNAGSTWGSALSLVGGVTFGPSAVLSGWFMISRVDQGNNQQLLVSNTTLATSGIEDTSNRGPIDALRFSFSAGSFDAGSIDIYGLK